MIINGFGGNHITTKDDWIDIPLVTYSGTTTLPSRTSFSGSRSVAHYSTEKSFVMPDVSGFQALVIKPNCMTFKTVNSTWPSSGATGALQLGMYIVETQLTADVTGSNESSLSWCFGTFRPNGGTSAAGHDMLSWGSSSVDASPITITVYRYDTTTKAPYTTATAYTNNFAGTRTLTSGHTYYAYLCWCVYSTNGMTSDITFSFSGSFALQGLPY